MVPSAASGAADPNVMMHWPRPGEAKVQRPAMLRDGAFRSTPPVRLVRSATPFSPLQAASAPHIRIAPTASGPAGFEFDGLRSRLIRSARRRRHFMVGMTNSAPSLVPDGQRAVTVLVLV